MAERNSPYRDIHSDLSSMFSSSQPIDTRIESIRNHIQKGIPNTLDTLLFLRGSLQTETSSNGAPGAIELFPALTATRLAGNGDMFRELKRSESILAALSDRAYLPMSHIRVYRSNGAVSEFSLAFGVPQSKKPAFELHGSLAIPGHTGDDVSDNEFYWLEVMEHGPVTPGFKLDEAAALDVINAACMQHNQDGVPESLVDKLGYLLEKSPSKSIRKSGEYAVNGGEKIIAANRNELVVRKMGRDAFKLTSYNVRIQQVIPVGLDGVGVASTLTLNHDVTARPKYNAFYDMIVNDPHQTIDRDVRTGIFEEQFMLYRSKPELFFDVIAESLEDATHL